MLQQSWLVLLKESWPLTCYFCVHLILSGDTSPHPWWMESVCALSGDRRSSCQVLGHLSNPFCLASLIFERWRGKSPAQGQTQAPAVLLTRIPTRDFQALRLNFSRAATSFLPGRKHGG